MATDGTRRQLEIVRTPRREHIVPEHFLEVKQQTNLFPSTRKGLVIFVHFPDVTEKEFREALFQSKPAYIFEFRSAPRFDIGTMNRRSAFRLFSEQCASYVDFACSSMGSSEQERAFIEFKAFAQNRQLSLERPLMVLMTKSDNDVENRIADFISSLTSEILEIFEVPHFSPA